MAQDHYVLLDRDGVINQDSDLFIKSPEEWLPIPGSLEAIALLNKHGFKVVVVTNQSGLARGLFNTSTLAAIHDKMLRMAAEKGGNIEAVYYCPHGPGDSCNCRKPKPGMLQQFSQEHNISLQGQFSVGDSYRDLQAAWSVGAVPLLVKTGKGNKTLAENPDLELSVFADLYSASQFIVTH